MSSSDLVFRGMRGRGIDHLAEGIVSKYQPNVLLGKGSFDIERFAEFDLEDYGFSYHISDELPHGIFGVTDCKSKEIWINAEISSLEHIRLFRSTAAHETGHSILHAPQILRAGRLHVFQQKKEDDSPRLYRESTVPIYKNPEWQAHRFAGALLMPSAPVINMVRGGALVQDLVDHFDVHPAFVKSRLRALKLLGKS